MAASRPVPLESPRLRPEARAFVMRLLQSLRLRMSFGCFFGRPRAERRAERRGGHGGRALRAGTEEGRAGGKGTRCVARRRARVRLGARARSSEPRSDALSLGRGRREPAAKKRARAEAGSWGKSRGRLRPRGGGGRRGRALTSWAASDCRWAAAPPSRRGHRRDCRPCRWASAHRDRAAHRSAAWPAREPCPAWMRRDPFSR